MRYGYAMANANGGVGAPKLELTVNCGDVARPRRGPRSLQQHNTKYEPHGCVCYVCALRVVHAVRYVPCGRMCM